jgi:hypothetical protein
MGNGHLTNKGILQNETFSVNLPSEDLVVLTDHIGMVSGTKEDKSGLFELFYGELDTAPMIQECKVTMECRLIDHVKLPTHDLFVGEVVSTYADGRAHQDRRHRQAEAAALTWRAKAWSLGGRWPGAGASAGWRRWAEAAAAGAGASASVARAHLPLERRRSPCGLELHGAPDARDC